MFNDTELRVLHCGQTIESFKDHILQRHKHTLTIICMHISVPITIMKPSYIYPLK